LAIGLEPRPARDVNAVVTDGAGIPEQVYAPFFGDPLASHRPVLLNSRARDAGSEFYAGFMIVPEPFKI